MTLVELWMLHGACAIVIGFISAFKSSTLSLKKPDLDLNNLRSGLWIDQFLVMSRVNNLIDCTTTVTPKSKSNKGDKLPIVQNLSY